MDNADALVEAINGWEPHDYHLAWDERDVITYALASGADLTDLPLLWEQAPLQVLPSYASRLGGESIRHLHESVGHLGFMSAASRMTVESFMAVPYRCAGADSVATARVVDRDDRRVLAELWIESSIAEVPLSRTIVQMHYRIPGGSTGTTSRSQQTTDSERPAEHWASTVTDPVGPYQAAAFRLLQGVSVGVERPDGMHIDPETSRSLGLGEPSLQGETMLAVACRNAGRVQGQGRYSSIRRISARLAGRIDLVDELTFGFSELVDGHGTFRAWNSGGRVVLDEGEVTFAESW